jgi:cysteine synthase A
MPMLESLSDKNKHIAIGAALGIFFTLSTTAVVLATRGSLSSGRRNSQSTGKSSRRRSSIGENISKQITLHKTKKNSQICDGVAGLIGNTPMMRIKSLSEATGCEILAKAEV